MNEGTIRLFFCEILRLRMTRGCGVETASEQSKSRNRFIKRRNDRIPVGDGASVKSKIVNSCARGLYTHFMFILYAFGSRTERSGERLPKAARGSI